MGSSKFPSGKGTGNMAVLVFVLSLFLSFFHSGHVFGQEKMPADTSAKDSSAAVKGMDSMKAPESSSALKSPIYYKAADSVIYDIEHKMVYLYGNVNIKYEDIELTASYVTIDWNTNTLCAEPRPDSSGKMKGYPVFKQGNEEIKTTKMCYNFITKKGRVNDLITKEGEGYIHGDVVKTVQKEGKQVSYVQNGTYTTCDYASEHGKEPHFYFKTKKLKLITNDKIITGPAYLVIEDVPTPLVLPFGFFPANSRKTSGLIPPSVGADAQRGYVVRGGGLYLGFSKYYDLALTTDIFTGGSYKVEGLTRYTKRYKFSGSLDLSIARNLYGLPETKDFKVSRDFNFRWTHLQDSKAHPGSSFSASVYFPSTKYLKNNTYDPSQILTQNVNSSITYSKQFIGTPLSLTVSATHAENLQDGVMDFTLPSLNLSAGRLILKKKTTTKTHWYNVGISPNFSMDNRLHTTEATLTKDISDFNNFQTGGTLTAPVSTNMKVLKWFTLSPSLNYSQYFYTKKYYRSDYSKADSVIVTPVNGFYTAAEGSANATLTTNIYGMLTLKRGRLVAIRHVMTPSISAGYRPDFSDPKWGYYSSYTDSTGKSIIYSPFTNPKGYGVPVPGNARQGYIGFSLNNNFQMKVRTRNDTTKSTKKVNLLDYFTISGSYNFLDTSFYKLSTINMRAQTTLFEKLTLTASGVLDPYLYDTLGKRKPKFLWDDQKKLGSFTSSEISSSISLNPKAKNKGEMYYLMSHPLIGYFYQLPYADFSVPWNVSLSYSLGYSKFSKKKFNQMIRANGQLSLTKYWLIRYSTGYDFTSKDFSFTEIDILRDLHCWEASLQWSPFGSRRYYLFNIRIKAATLHDLKLEKRKDFFDFAQ